MMLSTFSGFEIQLVARSRRKRIHKLCRLAGYGCIESFTSHNIFKTLEGLSDLDSTSVMCTTYQSEVLLLFLITVAKGTNARLNQAISVQKGIQKIIILYVGVQQWIRITLTKRWPNDYPRSITQEHKGDQEHVGKEAELDEQLRDGRQHELRLCRHP